METARSFENSQFLYAPVNLAAMGIVDSRHVAMRAEEMDRAGLFLISKEYVRPRALFQVELFLSDDEAPIHAIMTATFVERTWEGYGIAAEVSCSSIDDAARWSRFYKKALVSSTPGYSATFHLAKFLQRQRIAAMAGALTEATRDGLREIGVDVTPVWTAEEAQRLCQAGEVSLCILAEKDPLYDGAALCRSLATTERPPLVLMLIDSGAVRSFEGWLYAGATKVVARPCSPTMLVTRILALLQNPRAPYEMEMEAEVGFQSAPQREAITETRALSAIRSMLGRWVQGAVQFFSWLPQARSGL